MKIGILTSSRADFGIYLPLLRRLEREPSVQLKIIAFGTHLSLFHGYTLNQIKDAGFKVSYTVESLLLSDSPDSISAAIGLTVIKFSSFWKEHAHEFDLVFCLGDRYEMFAAVIAGVPLQIPFAHLHGGETTLGAIDDTFRHAITLASKYHFVSTNEYAKRVEEIINKKENIYNVGALGLDNLSELKLLSIDQFNDKWHIDLSKKTILVTYHPETINYTANEQYTHELIKVIEDLKEYQLLITMPNADTSGNYIRKSLIDNFSNSKHVFLVENLGSESYFTAMKYCSFLLGNTSSGIIEAASFGKYVINLGDRQKGRITGTNVINTPIKAEIIASTIREIKNLKELNNENLYFNGGAADQIFKILND